MKFEQSIWKKSLINLRTWGSDKFTVALAFQQRLMQRL